MNVNALVNERTRTTVTTRTRSAPTTIVGRATHNRLTSTVTIAYGLSETLTGVTISTGRTRTRLNVYLNASVRKISSSTISRVTTRRIGVKALGVKSVNTITRRRLGTIFHRHTLSHLRGLDVRQTTRGKGSRASGVRTAIRRNANSVIKHVISTLRHNVSLVTNLLTGVTTVVGRTECHDEQGPHRHYGFLSTELDEVLEADTLTDRDALPRRRIGHLRAGGTCPGGDK